jgi:hypothetical protein
VRADELAARSKDHIRCDAGRRLAGPDPGRGGARPPAAAPSEPGGPPWATAHSGYILSRHGADAHVANEHAPKLTRAAEDAILALVGLGYTHPKADAAVARVSAELGQEAETAALVRAGLKELAQ